MKKALNVFEIFWLKIAKKFECLKNCGAFLKENYPHAPKIFWEMLQKNGFGGQGTRPMFQDLCLTGIGNEIKKVGG